MRATLFVVIGIWLFGTFIVILGLLTHHDPSKPTFFSPTPVIIISLFPAHHVLILVIVIVVLVLGRYPVRGVETRCRIFVDVDRITALRSVLYSTLFLDAWKYRGRRTRMVETSFQMDFRARSASRRGAPSIVGDAGVSYGDIRLLGSVLIIKTHDRYPIVYSLSIMPLSVVRWTVYVQEAHTGTHQVPPAATFVAVSIFGLSGFFNVILLLTTRRTSGLFGELMFTAPSRTPIIFFRNERETREQGVVASQSKTGSGLYSELYSMRAK